MSSTQTTNYGLVKPTPGTGEQVSVQAHVNDNLDKIDQDMNRFDTQYFPSSGTWNKPARCKRVEVEVIGGGGAGGGAGSTIAGQAACGGGGGGGGYAKKLFLASALASSETIDVGAAGVPAVSGNNAGGNGGVSRFATGKAYVVTANGGNGGSGAAGAAAVSVNGGAGGTATGGDLNISGDQGGVGHVETGGRALFYATGGRSHYSGQVWPPAATAGTGTAGQLYGGGSSGAVEGASGGGRASLAGAAGIVIVRNYY